MIAFALMVLAVAAPNAELAEGARLVERLEEKKALLVLHRALEASAAPDERARIYLYIGLAHAGLAEEAAARESFRSALRLNPEISLPDGMSPTILAWFEDARQAVLPPRRDDAPRSEKRVDALREPRVVVGDPPPSVAAATDTSLDGRTGVRWMRVAGFAAGGASAVLAGSGLYLGGRARSLATAAVDEPYGSRAAALQRDANGAATAANVLFGAAAIAVGAAAALLLLE